MAYSNGGGFRPLHPSISPSLHKRLWEKIERTEANECWLFNGYKSKGYGKIGEGGRYGKILRAHRVVYQEIHGPIPIGMEVLHHCDNPSCCNPDHLFLGSQADNMIDKQKKGRCRNTDSRGERNNAAILTEKQVLDIRADSRILREIAEDYGVATSTIHAIRKGVNWSHV